MQTGSNITVTFAALGDPVRRGIVDFLAAGDATVNEIAALFPISLQAVSKHIKVLEAAGIVSKRRDGKSRPVRLETAALIRSATWLEAHALRDEARYGRLDELLNAQRGASTDVE